MQIPALTTSSDRARRCNRRKSPSRKSGQLGLEHRGKTEALDFRVRSGWCSRHIVYISGGACKLAHPEPKVSTSKVQKYPISGSLSPPTPQQPPLSMALRAMSLDGPWPGGNWRWTAGTADGGGAHFLCERVFMLRTVECRAEVGLGHRPSSGGRGRPNSGGRTGAPGP